MSTATETMNKIESLSCIFLKAISFLVLGKRDSQVFLTSVEVSKGIKKAKKGGGKRGVTVF
jgi:hypothetical protein